MNATKAKNLYHGWTGWGGRGLAIELTDYSMAQLSGQGPGHKRMREGDGEWVPPAAPVLEHSKDGVAPKKWYDGCE